MLTREHATTVRALASLARFVPQRMRAEHLIGKAEAVALEIERAVEMHEQVTAAFAEPTEVR